MAHGYRSPNFGHAEQYKNRCRSVQATTAGPQAAGAAVPPLSTVSTLAATAARVFAAHAGAVGGRRWRAGARQVTAPTAARAAAGPLRPACSGRNRWSQLRMEVFASYNWNVDCISRSVAFHFLYSIVCKFAKKLVRRDTGFIPLSWKFIRNQ